MFMGKQKPILSYWSLDHKALFAASNENVREVRIATPFGHIAAKEYGDADATHKMLAVHGWMDNCGSFEKLLPLIVKENDLHVIAMDEPGCGLSSHLPVGVELPKFTLLKEMKRVANFMQWDNFSIIGHSKGAGFGLLYASVMPESVKSVIMLDAFYTHFYGISAPDMSFDVSGLNMLLEYEQKLINKSTSKVQTFNEQETLKKFMTALPVPKSEAVARTLMKRGSREKNGGFALTRDVRHRFPIFGSIASKEEYLKLAKNLRCDLLVISATKSPFRVVDKTDWRSLCSH
ncbi:Serine hydrolase-like protein [Leptotrombidium deliense]|uniref:Serine hydrolase-like protein n=1 Tax=Leptotrombidium deliense TaxID=299467 RepID=A0A443SFQ0_9ACAR|nr:Serine hydrolase-like protein [Leptotrombidium deliense]